MRRRGSSSRPRSRRSRGSQPPSEAGESARRARAAEQASVVPPAPGDLRSSDAPRRPSGAPLPPSIAEAVAAYGWPPKHSAAADAPDPPITPQSWGPALSPDGRRVAFVSDVSGAPRAYVLGLAPSAGGLLTDSGGPRMLETGGEPVVDLAWSPDGAFIACTIAPGGSVRHEVWLIRPDGSDLRLAAGAAQGTAILCGFTTGTGRLAVTHASSAQERRVALIEPASGHATTVAADELLLLADVSPDEQSLVLRRGPRSARWLALARLAEGGSEQPLFGISAAADGGESGSSDQAHFSADGQTVFVRSDVAVARAVLYAVDLAHGTAEVVAERADAELEGFAVSRDRRVWVLSWNLHGGKSALSVFDPDRRSQRPLAGPPGEVVSGLSLSDDGAVLALSAEGPAQPRDIWLVHLATGRSTRVTDSARAAPQARDRVSSAPAPGSFELHELVAADGVRLTGWLYGAGSTDGPGPLVIHLHGGPEAQERPVWNPLYGHLVERGLRVFAPNVRGSSGFGRAFVHADNRERRSAAIADVQACAEYLLERSIAAPGQLGCMGRSYGGYLTLAALVHYPELFAVGVDMCGMADLSTFYERTERWIAAQAVSKYGHPEHDRELLHELSPLHRFERLAAPLLVVHGAHDTNVPLYEAEQVVRELASRGLPGGFLLFSDEGHELVQHRNQAKYIRVVGEWLVSHLRNEPSE